MTRVRTSRLHELHESKFPFVSRIEFIRSKLSIFSAHVYGVNTYDGQTKKAFTIKTAFPGTGNDTLHSCDSNSPIAARPSLLPAFHFAEVEGDGAIAHRLLIQVLGVAPDIGGHVIACWAEVAVSETPGRVRLTPVDRSVKKGRMSHNDRVNPVLMVGSGLVRLDRVRSSRVESSRVESGRVGSGRVGSGRVGSGRVGSGQAITGRVIPDPVESDWIERGGRTYRPQKSAVASIDL